MHHASLVTLAGASLLLVNGAILDSRAPAEGYTNPSSGGGSMLTKAENTFPEGLGEPINIIISANSDASILQNTDTGLQDYFRSLNFSGECLGKHLGTSQKANLGDGNGELNETAVMRFNFGQPFDNGACTESIQGGNHFRYWIQNGGQANTGAIFIASSYEKAAKDNHDIVVNGYNLGRDLIVGNITGSALDFSSLSSSSTFSGSTTSKAQDNSTTSYSTSVQYVSGLLNKGADGVNHANTVGVDGKDPVDGLVAVLTVKQTGKGSANSSTDQGQTQPNAASSSTAQTAYLTLTIPSAVVLLVLALSSLILY